MPPMSPAEPMVNFPSSPSSSPSPSPQSTSSPLALDRFPPELRIIILDHMQHTGPLAIFNLISTCQSMYNQFTPYLYRTITIRQSNAHKVFSGIIIRPEPQHMTLSNMVLDSQVAGLDFAIATPDMIEQHVRKLSLLEKCETLIIQDHHPVKNIASALLSTKKACKKIKSIDHHIGEIQMTQSKAEDGSQMGEEDGEEEDEDEEDEDEEDDDHMSEQEEEGDDGDISPLFPKLVSIRFESTSFFELWDNSNRGMKGTTYIMFLDLKPKHVCVDYDISSKHRINGMMSDLQSFWDLESFTWHDVVDPNFNQFNPARHVDYHLAPSGSCSLHDGSTSPSSDVAEGVEGNEDVSRQCTCSMTPRNMIDFVLRMRPAKRLSPDEAKDKRNCTYIGLYNIPQHYTLDDWTNVEKEIKEITRLQPLTTIQTSFRDQKEHLKDWRQDFKRFLADSKRRLECVCCGKF